MRGRLTGRRWLTVVEFCAATGEKPDTVRDRCERGAYRAKRVGHRWRIAAGEIERHHETSEGR